MSNDLGSNVVDKMDVIDGSFVHSSQSEQLNLSVDVASTSQHVEVDIAPSIIAPPHKGQKIATDEEAYEVYNAYALHRGFGVRKESVKKSWRTKEPNNRTFTCNRHRIAVDSNTIKCGCNAKMIIKREGDHWVVSKFDDTHNHDMSTPGRVKKYFSYKRFARSKAARGSMESLSFTELKEPITSNLSNDDAIEDSQLVTTSQCREYLKPSKKNTLGAEFLTTNKQFDEKKAEEKMFYFAVELTDTSTTRPMTTRNDVTPIMKFAMESTTRKLLDRAFKDKAYYDRLEKLFQAEIACIQELEKTDFVEKTSAVTVLSSSSTLENDAPSNSISRMKLDTEKAHASKAKGEQKTCGHCKVKGHYRTGCPLLKNPVNNANASGKGEK